MGIFFHNEPDYFPNMRHKGFARYTQVLERDWKQFFLVDLLTLASLIPFGLGVGYAVLSSSILVLLAACVMGGAIAGPGIACMYDRILRSLRDDQADWWYSYKKAMKQNVRAAILPGILMCLFIGFLIFAGAMLWWSELPITAGTIAILTASVVLCLMILSVWWPQIVLFDQKPGIQLKNCLLFCIRYFGKTLKSAAVQLLFWVVMVLFLPWSAFVVPFLGVWYVWYVSTFLIYEELDEAFSIEDRVWEAFPEQMPVYEV